MEKEKTKGRNFTQLKKAMSEEELRKFCKKIAEEYADSKGEYARSYFVKEYDISGSCFYKILETSIIKNWVSDETMLKMEEKAVENQKVHAETAGLSTRKHYSEMRQKRQEYIISFYTEKEIEDLENQQTEIQNEMANPEIATNFDKLGPLQEKLSAVQEKLDQANDEWEKALTALDEFE